MKKEIFLTHTSKIIAANIVLYMLLITLGSIFDQQKVVTIIALQPAAILSGKHLWTIITSMFAHLEIWHILANMVSLFFLGMFVERLIGKKRFLTFYLASGIFAGVFYVTLSFLFGSSSIGAKLFGSPTTLALGASGAIFGLLGLLAVLTPNTKVSLIAGPLIVLILQTIISSIYPSRILGVITYSLVMAYFFIATYALFSMMRGEPFGRSLKKIIIPLEMPMWLLPIVAIVPLVIIGLIFPLPIGNTAHLGGLISGLCYGFYLRKKYPKKTKMISTYFSR